MPFSYRKLLFGGNTFCCCLPVRLGVISMSILGCLVSGLLTVLLWFEVSSSTSGLSGQERAAFIVAGLTETILFIASMLGLAGGILRKQSFIQPYAYILYVHFVLNVGVAAYLTYEVTHTVNHDQNLACKLAIKDPQAQDQCSGFLEFATWVYLIIAAVVILVELYGVVIVTRYLNQLQREKGAARAVRMDTESAFQLKYRNGSGHQYARLHDPAIQSELPPLQHYLEPSDTEFDPYTESGTLPEHSNSRADGQRSSSPLGREYSHDSIGIQGYDMPGRSNDLTGNSEALHSQSHPSRTERDEYSTPHPSYGVPTRE